MLKEIQKDSSLIRLLIILLIIALCAHLFNIFWQVINVFSDIIGIVVIAWLLSFVLEPFVDQLTNLTKLSKTAATAVTYLLLLTVFVIIGVLFVPLVTNQIQTLSRVLPLFLASAPPVISRWGDALTSTLTNAIVFLPSVAQFLLSVMIVLVISFYFIIDKDRINHAFFALTPTTWHEKMRFIQKVIAKTFSSFLHIQLIIGLLTGIATWVVLQIFGVQFALAIALLAGLLGALPLIGPILAAIPPVFFTFIIDPTLAIIVLLILVIIQQIIFNVFVPRAFGKAFKMHPVVILLASIAGFKLGGPTGAIFAIPIAGISAVILRDIWEYFMKKNDNI